MASKTEQKADKSPTPKVVLPKGVVEVEPGVYVMREVKSAFAALSARPPKTDK